MIIFPDHNLEIEYTDPNGSVWDWNGVGWVRQCSGGGDSKPEGYDDIKAIASGVMTTGEMVVVNDDGTVSVVAGTTTPPGPGTPEVFNSSNTLYTSTTYDPLANKVVVAYKDFGNSQYGTAIVGTVSGSSITFGAPVVFASNGNTEDISSTYDSVNNKVVISYRDRGNSGSGTAVVGTVSGNSITFGSPVVFNSADPTYISSTYDSVNNKVVIAYMDSGNSNYGTAIVGTVSGNSITFGSSVVYKSGAVGYISTTYDSVNSKVVIAYADTNQQDYGNAVVGTVSGDSISFGSPVVFNSARSPFISSTYDPVNSKVVISYRNDGNSSYGTAIAGTVSGDSITFGAPVVFNSGNTQAMSLTCDSANNNVVISYKDVGNSGLGTVIVGTLSGNSITFDTPEVFSIGSTSSTSSTYNPVNKKVVIAYGDDGTLTGTAVTYSSSEGFSTNLTDSNYIGVSTGNYGDGTEATVQIAGINADQQGMTIGKQYILPDGSLTTDEGSVVGDYEFGTPEVFNNAGIGEYNSITYDPVNNKVIIAYDDGGNSNYGTAVAGAVSGDSISFGAPEVFNSNGSNWGVSATYDPVNNKVVIAYLDIVNSGYGTAIVGTVSGDSISFGDPVVFANTSSGYVSTIYDPVANKVVVAYSDYGSDNGKAVLATVSGDSITFGVPVVFGSGSSKYTSCTYDSANNKVIISYANGSSGYGTSVVGTVSGDSMTFGTPVRFYAGNTITPSSTYDPVAKRVVIAYRKQTGNRAVVGAVSGDSITFGSDVSFSSNGASLSISATYDSASNKVVIAYGDGGNSNYGTTIAGAVSGDSISFDTPVVFNSASSDRISSTYDSANGRLVISYRDRGNSNYGTAVTYGAAGEPNVFAGTAISSTELNIKDTVL